jgi:hypothetical protein
MIRLHIGTSRTKKKKKGYLRANWQLPIYTKLYDVYIRYTCLPFSSYSMINLVSRGQGEKKIAKSGHDDLLPYRRGLD